jgi:hypothetical protein
MASIKELLLSALETDMAGIAGITSVKLNSVYLPKGDDPAYKKPFIRLVDMNEELVEDNRYRVAAFDLIAVAYVHSDLSENLSPDLDAMHAKVYERMCKEGMTFKNYCVRFKEKSVEKMYFNETEGAVLSTWMLTYRVCRGNPYTMEPNP